MQHVAVLYKADHCTIVNKLFFKDNFPQFYSVFFSYFHFLKYIDLFYLNRFFSFGILHKYNIYGTEYQKHLYNCLLKHIVL